MGVWVCGWVGWRGGEGGRVVGDADAGREELEGGELKEIEALRAAAYRGTLYLFTLYVNVIKRTGLSTPERDKDE